MMGRMGGMGKAIVETLSSLTWRKAIIQIQEIIAARISPWI